MAKKLKCWNGIIYYGPRDRDKDSDIWGDMGSNAGRSVYVCACSRADALRVVEEYMGGPCSLSDKEMKDYWFPRWGPRMQDIERERGLWVKEGMAHGVGEIRRVL